MLAWRLVQFWLPIPLGAISYASLKLGPLGRRRRLTAVRTLAAEAGVHAMERVWDQKTGEYRIVPVGQPSTPASGPGGPSGPTDGDDEDVAASGWT